MPSLHTNLRLLLTTSLFVLALSSMARAQSCLAYGPQVSLNGTLRSQVFPGPPNYQSIKQGDSKETAIILRLRRTTCTTGNDPSGVDVPEKNICEMQLVITESADWQTGRRLKGKRVLVTGTLFHAITGHHRTKVLIQLSSIRAR